LFQDFIQSFQYIGEETIFSIGGPNDLNNKILLCSGKTTTIHRLLKCLPASSGMSRLLLFQNAEPNSSNIITMVSYQKQDHELVIARQATLETELCNIIAPGEQANLFLNPDDSIWFGGVKKSNSPPKKHSHQDQPFPAPITRPTLPCPTTTPNSVPIHLLDSARVDIDSKFESIQNEFNSQRIFNTQVDFRISKLETTSVNIDSKVDQIILHLEQALPQSTPNKNIQTTLLIMLILPCMMTLTTLIWGILHHVYLKP
jgi:hypothetical protein